MIARICEICGKSFLTWPYKIKVGKGRYCSNKCFGKRLAVDFKGKNGPGWKGGGIKKTCIICKKEFTIGVANSNNGEGKFCSHKCKGDWQSINYKGDKSLCWKPKIKKTCIECGKPFKTKSNHSKFCSQKCYWDSLSKRKGDKTSNWQGGITPIIQKIRNSEKYNKWRQEVFVKDNFTCHKCNTRGGYLHAHHIKGFSVIINEIKANLPLLGLYEASMIYTPLWDIQNGVTLCKKCHFKGHRK